MAKIKIDQEKCKGCLLCISACPKGFLKAGNQLNKKGARYVEFGSQEECLGCLMCTLVCPECCIEIWKE